MRAPRRARGFMLIVAMIVLVVLTLLVVGAIAFTGSERISAANQVSAETLDACTNAARNMFLSRMNFLQGKVDVKFDETVTLAGGKTYRVKSGHFINSQSSTLVSLKKLDSNKVSGAGTDVQDLSNRLGDTFGQGGYYDVTATCIDTGTGAAQEVEFTFRLGI